MTTAAIVVVGNEILSAKVVDENGPYLARELRALGVELRRIETVPDEVPLIVDAIQRCRKEARWLFTSGGIGPTHDDVTIAAVAASLGRRVVQSEGILSALESFFGGKLNAAKRRLADVPEGSEVHWSAGNPFPVISCESIFIFPGVPSLLRQSFTQVREQFRAPPIFSRAVYFSVGESVLAEHLDATVAAWPSISIGSYPRFDDADHRVKVTFDGRVEAEVREAAGSLKARLPRDTVVRED